MSTMDEAIGSLSIEIHSADLTIPDSRADPYVKVTVYHVNLTKPTNWKTTSKQNTNKPKWNETFSTSIYHSPVWFVMECWTTALRHGEEDQYVGQCKVECPKKDVSVDNLWVPLQDKRAGDHLVSSSGHLAKGKLSISYQLKWDSKGDSTGEPAKGEKTPRKGDKHKPTALESGRKIFTRKKKEKSRDRNIFELMEENDVESILEALDHIPVATCNRVDQNGFSLLHIACIDCQRLVKVLYRLLEFKGIEVNIRNTSKNTPLHYLCANWYLPDLSVFDTFFKLGADVNALNDSKETPLFKAITNNTLRKPILKVLLEVHGASPNSLNSHGEGILHYAARLGRVDLVSLILKFCDDINIRGAEGKTPLQIADAESNSKSNDPHQRSNFKEIANILCKAQDLYEFLQRLKLDEYRKYFIENELFVDDLCAMNEEEMGRLDLKLGPKHKLIAGLKEMQQVYEQKKRTPKSDPELSGADLDTANIEKLKRQLQELNDVRFIDQRELEFLDELGRGASGSVWKGLLRTSNSPAVPCAIKLLYGLNSSEEIDEFTKEVRVLNLVSHACVMKLFGVVLRPKPCMVMEFCSRGSLYHVLCDEKLIFEWELFFSVTTQIIDGLQALHQFTPQILHRDLKSLNIIMTENFGVRVADFGLSLSATASSNALRGIQGTAAYMAPELLNGAKYNSKCDIYSLALILWEMVFRVITGGSQKPYSEYKELLSPGPAMILMQVSQGLRPTIPEGCPDIIATLIKREWDGNPDVRGDLGDVRSALQRAESNFKKQTAQWNAKISRHTDTIKSTFQKRKANMINIKTYNQ